MFKIHVSRKNALLTNLHFHDPESSGRDLYWSTSLSFQHPTCEQLRRTAWNSPVNRKHKNTADSSQHYEHCLTVVSSTIAEQTGRSTNSSSPPWRKFQRRRTEARTNFCTCLIRNSSHIQSIVIHRATLSKPDTHYLQVDEVNLYLVTNITDVS